MAGNIEVGWEAQLVASEWVDEKKKSGGRIGIAYLFTYSLKHKQMGNEPYWTVLGVRMEHEIYSSGFS